MLNLWERPMRRPLRILIVDDDKNACRLMEKSLTKIGSGLVTTHSSHTLQDALEEASKGSCSAVLLDLQLPDARDIEGVECFQNKHPELPVIVISGNSDPDIATRCIHAGAEDFILKGTDPSNLLEEIRTAVVRHEVRREHRPMKEMQDDLRGTICEVRKLTNQLESLKTK